VNDLQFSLLVIGATIIGGVYLYNWVQERRVRKRLDRAFANAPDDVLLARGPDAPDGARIEPHLQAAATGTPAARADSGNEVTGAAARPARSSSSIDFDPDLDYVAEIVAGAAIAQPVMEELLSKVAECGRPTRVLGLNADTGAWEELSRSGPTRYARLQLGLQLVNRSGSVDAAQLSMFCDAARTCAGKAQGRAACPDLQVALRTARDLDAFCSGVDVAIGVNVVANNDAMFSGTRIRELAESAGFKLEPDGVFHYRDGRRRTLFILDNHEPAPFLPEQIKKLTTRGITLMLDVPRVADGPAVLDRMIDIGRELAGALGGTLVDDNRAALSEAGIDRIREQLRSIHAALAARGIAAGGERASRLFS
jgi:hypothetical protein